MLLPYNFSQKHLCICIYKYVSNGVMDGYQTMDRPSNPDLLCSQMGYIFLENSNADVALQLFQKNIFVYVFTT